ncbi:MAG: hypothetical protein LBL90_13970 [Prevotellaceae bacterium]|jgi:hypothetical protein|nr:hypothetical protein [Prevotellaceae bacterium]
MGEYLHALNYKTAKYSVVLYELRKLFLDSNAVSRDLCEIDDNNRLMTIFSQEEIIIANTISYQDEYRHQIEIPGTIPTSVGFWGFVPDFFDFAKHELKTHREGEAKERLNIPLLINKLIVQVKIEVEDLQTSSNWMNIAAAADKLMAVLKINEMAKKGEYPPILRQPIHNILPINED